MKNPIYPSFGDHFAPLLHSHYMAESMTRVLTLASMTAAVVAILISCTHVFAWSQGFSSFLDSAFPFISQPSDQAVLAEGRDSDRNATRKWNVMEHLGGNSPWIRKRSGVASGVIHTPSGCQVEQVHMVCRSNTLP